MIYNNNIWVLVVTKKNYYNQYLDNANVNPTVSPKYSITQNLGKKAHGSKP